MNASLEELKKEVEEEKRKGFIEKYGFLKGIDDEEIKRIIKNPEKEN